MKRSIVQHLVTAILAAAVLAGLAPSRVYAAVGWVGNMQPRPGAGSPASRLDGEPLEVTVQVYQAGVTEAAGAGAGIACTLYWSRVPAFGGQWAAIRETPMAYHADAGNDDVHRAAIAPPAGLYEFTTYCSDDGGRARRWQPDGNGQLAVSAPITQPAGRRALWLDRATLAWAGEPAATYRLLYDPDGAMDLAAAESLPLAVDGQIGPGDYAQFPNAGGLTRLRLPAAAVTLAPELLRGPLAVAAYDDSGRLVDATGVQIQGVLDDLFTYDGALGVAYANGAPTLRVWAPTAHGVTLHRFADALSATAAITQPMARLGETGVWALTGDPTWDRQFYLLEVEVFVPATGRVEHNLVTDPYAVSLAMNSTRSQFVDLAGDPTLKPDGWDSLRKPFLAAPEDAAIYEVHVRDFSRDDETVPAGQRGKFLAFTDVDSDGMRHLLQLRQAGLTHVHLMPAFDFATVNEDASQRRDPDPAALSLLPGDAITQQLAVAATRQVDSFNWGYDPLHYGVPEGSYAVDPDGAARILEFRRMVQSLNQQGLRVVMDVVYNHTYAAGQEPTSVLDRIVPGYYHRYDLQGNLQQSSCCPDTASEFAMMQKLLVDMTLRWATAYQVDGFRFDLMNLHTVENMADLRAALDALTPAADGVDGPALLLYGEGWDFGSAKEKGLRFAGQANMAGTGIGSFNDRLRDAAHGGHSTDPLQIRRQGFVNGLAYDWNGHCYGGRDQADLLAAMDRLRVALAGSVDDFTADPQETVNYVSKHDNEALYDLNAFRAPYGHASECAAFTAPTATLDDRVRMQNLALSLVGLAQGVPFFDLGSDLLRSKSLDRNSYDSGDWFNRVDYTGEASRFGGGLPPAWDNAVRWPIMQPLLADAQLVSGPEHVQANAAHLRELLRIRRSSALFRLRDAAEIRNRVAFFDDNEGRWQPSGRGVLIMGLSDVAGGDLDANLEYVLVVFNADKVTRTVSLPWTAGLDFSLHPVQADGQDADPAVRSAAFDRAAGRFSVPPRTTAVFVSRQAPPLPAAVEWVGDMFPAGAGGTQQRTEGDDRGLEVYVQVYQPGVTGRANRSTGDTIACTLRWGQYSEAWSDAPMAFNPAFGGNPNNDEYMATLSTRDLAPGAYGFTAYCSDETGNTPRWRTGADGLFTVTPDPAADAVAPSPPGGVFVHLFEWRWADIERECAYLAQAGYSAVQVSPPMEHLPPFPPDYPWWVRYQPVSYSLAQSRSGTLDEFRAMVETCRSLGVDIYVDAVINHMTGVGSGRGTAGSAYAVYDYVDYDPVDFNRCGTPGNEIGSYGDRRQVQGCELVNLADLDVLSPRVQGEIRGYLQGLLDLGVAGFRIDAAKHMPSHAIAAILDGLVRPDGRRPYVFQEVIDLGGEPVQSFEYTPNGDVTEFRYSRAIANAFTAAPGCPGPNLANLESLGQFMVDGAFAVVFTDNHDNQRGHGAGGSCIVDHRDGDALYNLANIFLLAHPYGYPKVMSSYTWDGLRDAAGPPSTIGPAGSGPETLPVYADDQIAGDVPARCADGVNWVCEHRRPPMANLVRFRQVTAGEPLTHWQAISRNHIAFGRGDKGFVAINREDAPATAAYQTGLPAGRYCDVTQFDFADGQCVLPGTAIPAPAGALVTVDASGRIADRPLAAMGALAIHAAARVGP